MCETQWKIIKIIDDRTVIIDAGINSGLTTGQALIIVNIGEKVIHPDTNEILGHIETIKGHLEVINIMDKMTLCKSPEEQVEIPSIMTGVGGAFVGKPRYKNTRAPLNVNPESITGGANNSNYIDIGDIVKLDNH